MEMRELQFTKQQKKQRIIKGQTFLKWDPFYNQHHTKLDPKLPIKQITKKKTFTHKSLSKNKVGYTKFDRFQFRSK